MCAQVKTSEAKIQEAAEAVLNALEKEGGLTLQTQLTALALLSAKYFMSSDTETLYAEDTIEKALANTQGISQTDYYRVIAAAADILAPRK